MLAALFVALESGANLKDIFSSTAVAVLKHFIIFFFFELIT